MSVVTTVKQPRHCTCISLQNQSQIETLKSSLEEEIEYHKDQIDDHEVWMAL